MQRKKELKIKAKVSSNSKFAKKLKAKENQGKNVKRIKTAVHSDHGDHHLLGNTWQTFNSSKLVQEANVDDIPDIESEQPIDGYLQSVEQKYELKANRKQASQTETETEVEVFDEVEDDEEKFDQQTKHSSKFTSTNDDDTSVDITKKIANQSVIQNLVMVRNMKASLLEMLAVSGNAIMSHPEANINRLKRLLTLLDISTDDAEYGPIFFTVQKKTTEALYLIFDDILPNYRYAERFNATNENIENKRKKHALKKDTMKTFLYEKTVLQCYHLFLQRLKRMIDAYLHTDGSSKSNFYRVMLTTDEARYQLANVAIICVTELMTRHYGFNYCSELVDIVARVMCNTKVADEKFHILCSRAFSRLFHVDTLGETTLDAVNHIADFIIKQNYRVPPIVFNTFLSLNFKELINDKNDVESSKKVTTTTITTKSNGRKVAFKKDRKMMSRRERKEGKRRSKWEKELLEVEAVENHDKRYAYKVDIHKRLFALYFRFVKRILNISSVSADSEIRDLNQWYRPLFPSLFQGMAQFSVYLNDVYIYELVESLLRLIPNASNTHVIPNEPLCRLSSTEKLCCLKTISQILRLSDDSLSIDFQVPYLILYELCSDPLVVFESMQMLLECIDEMIVKRFKQLSLNRVISFIQRLLFLSLYLPGAEVIAFLTVIKRLAQLHPGVLETLLDTEQCESGPMVPKFHSNSEATTMMFINDANSLVLLHLLLHQHSHPYVRFLANAIVLHYSDSHGRATNIMDNRSVAKLTKELKLNASLCQTLLQSSCPMRAYNAINLASVNFEHVFPVNLMNVQY